MKLQERIYRCISSFQQIYSYILSSNSIVFRKSYAGRCSHAWAMLSEAFYLNRLMTWSNTFHDDKGSPYLVYLLLACCRQKPRIQLLYYQIYSSPRVSYRRKCICFCSFPPQVFNDSTCHSNKTQPHLTSNNTNLGIKIIDHEHYHILFVF